MTNVHSSGPEDSCSADFSRDHDMRYRREGIFWSGGECCSQQSILGFLISARGPEMSKQDDTHPAIQHGKNLSYLRMFDEVLAHRG